MTLVPLESLRLHPDSERVPLASPSDLAALRVSLQENGQQDPIDVTPDGLILDGRTRWTLLGELGVMTASVREVVIPDRDQTHYIVDRALARRHLTADQKRALNALLAASVVAVETSAKTGEEMRIGMSRSERAAKLGVTVATVQNWDGEDRTNSGAIPPDQPTHIRRGGGNPTPYPVAPAKPSRATPRSASKPERLRKDRPIPAWSRHFSTFCRRSRPEDHEFLLRMAREIHAALRQNGIEYQED